MKATLEELDNLKELKFIDKAIDKKLEALVLLYHEIVISHTNGKNPRTLSKK